MPSAQPRVSQLAFIGMTVLVALVALVAALTLYFAARRLAGSTAGRIALLFGVFFLPLVAVSTGAHQAYQESSSTEFCLSCHEMGNHGRSLFVDDRSLLPAVHYQKRLIDRDHACFECHGNYTMFGHLQAKMAGLNHVKVHYLGEIPEVFELYEPFPNGNCLQCHDDARSYLEMPAHKGHFEAMSAGEESCLGCHATGHGLDKVQEGSFWVPE